MVEPSSSPAGLVEVLRALPQGELHALTARLGITIDPKKRLDAPMQIARVLVTLGELGEPTRLPVASAQLLRRIVEAGGTLCVPSLPVALEPLAARGIVYAKPHASAGVELVLPVAFLIQIPPWEGEDPRGLRALIAQASHDTLVAIASHYLGKPATPPVALVLETAWAALSSPAGVRRVVESLASAERRLLEAIELDGGEVDTEELLDLEREPLRLRGATGATPSRRGIGFSLERRGMLMPVHPNRHVIPREVAAVIGAAHAQEREARRAQIRAFVLDSHREPRRARFAADPAPLTVALALAAREPGAEVREGAGTPRSLIQRLAQRFGREPEAVALVVALSRALGLWDPSALSRQVSPGSLRMSELAQRLFAAWQKGGAWDEARPDPEVLRVPIDSRDPSPIGVLRDIVLDALSELSEGRWVPFEALADYVRSDARTAGVSRLIRRWAERVSLEAPTPTDVARRIVLESLPTLGIIDLGESHFEDSDADLGPMVRITPRGRAILQGEYTNSGNPMSEFLNEESLRLGFSTPVAHILSLAQFVEVGKVGEVLELVVTQSAITRAVSLGLEGPHIRGGLEAICPLSDHVSHLLEQLSVVLGRASFVAVSGFLWCDDPNVRDLLRTRRQTSDLFVDPSPPGGLLIAPGKDLEALTRRCRTLGVEVLVDGQLVRAASTTPPGKPEWPSTRRSNRPPAFEGRVGRR